MEQNSTRIVSKRKRTAEEEKEKLNQDMPKRARELMPQVAGKVLRIELENFMCHSNLVLQFDVATNNCFYIIGPNGSGKSALFAGLNIGLGGSGRTNERGKTIQSFIKEGKQSARIRIDLTNQGPNKCTAYDEVIIIERIITEKSSSITIKTCSLDGGRKRVVSKKKSDIDALLEQLNIGLDNPLAWLSQDRSRQFLQQMKPEKLYQLYRKTSEMDNTDLLFQSIESHFDEFCRILNSLDDEKKRREENYQHMLSRHRAAKEMTEKKKERQKLIWYSLWAPIRDNENKIHDLDARMAEAIKKKSQTFSEMEKRESERTKITQEQAELVPKREQELSNSREQHQQLMNLKKNDHEFNFEIHDIEVEIRKKEHKKASLDTELTVANKNLEKIIGDSNRNIDEERQALKQKQIEIVRKIEIINKGKTAANLNYQHTLDEFNEQKKKQQNQSAELSQLEKSKSKLKETLFLIENSKLNRLALFGEHVPKLVELIGRNLHLFGKTPIGPIGNYIKLKDEKWAHAVEFALKRLLNTFICDSQKDRIAIDELCRSNNIKAPEIITTTFTSEKFDISAKVPSADFLTVERILEEIEPSIYNVLIDLTYIESILLFEGDDEARTIMYSSPPQNATYAMTLSCSQAIPASGRKAYRFYSNNQFQGRILATSFLAQDGTMLANQVKQLEHQIQEKQRAKFKIDQTVHALSMDEREANLEINNLQRQLDELNGNLYGVDEELQKLNQIMLSGEKIGNLQESINEIRLQVANCVRQLNAIRTNHAAKEQERNELKKRIEAVEKATIYSKNRVKQIEANIESCALQVEKIDHSLQDDAENIRRFEQNEKRYKEEIADFQKDNNTRQAAIKSNSMEIIHESDEVPDFEKIPQTDELGRSLKAIERYIKIEENNQEPIPSAQDLKQKEVEYNKFRDDHDVWVRRKQKLVHIKDCRKRRFNLLKTSLPQKIANFFTDYMNFRGYKASLHVNDEKGIIELRLHRAGDDLSTSGNDDERSGRRRKSQNSEKEETSKRLMQEMKGMSGGERSFTTISFVMALWSCMEAPFRCSDEFDVFMDPVNRRIAMEMLTDMTNDNKHIQFFFFTPQGIKELTNADESNVRVFELERIEGLFDGQQRENEEAMDIGE